MFGALLRCKVCNQYTPDRCTCKPDPSLKGVKDGNCNREACQHPGATWFNSGTHKYYCCSCAKAINGWCKHDSVPLLCSDTKNA